MTTKLWWAALFSSAGLLACGGGSKITVDLTTSGDAVLDPYKASDRLALVRVNIDGPDLKDDAIRDVPLDQRAAVFDRFPGDRTVQVEVSGFDELGTRIAYGRADGVAVAGDTNVTVAFRRTLAYVTHRAVCDGGCNTGSACVNFGSGYACRPSLETCAPACSASSSCVDFRGAASCYHTFARTTPAPGLIYVIDATTRALVKKIQLPGDAPRGFGVSARGGEGVLVTYADGANGFVGFVSADDSQVTSIPLSKPQSLALIGPGRKVGAAAGGGLISFFDFEQKKVIKEVAVGGTVLDGALGLDGKRAIFVVSTSPGVVIVDLENPEGRDSVKSPGEVSGASGVAVSEDGRVAFVSSRSGRTLNAIDLDSGRITELAEGFATRAGAAAFSARMLAVLAIQYDDDGPAPRIVAYSVAASQGFPLETAVGTLPLPSDIAAGPGGGRLVVVSAGTSSTTAGLTVIDTDDELPPEGSSTTYPRDPDDTYLEGSFVAHQRYQPNKLGLLYGR